MCGAGEANGNSSNNFGRGPRGVSPAPGAPQGTPSPGTGNPADAPGGDSGGITATDIALTALGLVPGPIGQVATVASLGRFASRGITALGGRGSTGGGIGGRGSADRSDNTSLNPAPRVVAGSGAASSKTGTVKAPTSTDNISRRRVRRGTTTPIAGPTRATGSPLLTAANTTKKTLLGA